MGVQIGQHRGYDYSVHPKAVGRRVHVRVDDAHVAVTLGGEVVARHDRVPEARSTGEFRVAPATNIS